MRILGWALLLAAVVAALASSAMAPAGPGQGAPIRHPTTFVAEDIVAEVRTIHGRLNIAARRAEPHHRQLGHVQLAVASGILLVEVRVASIPDGGSGWTLRAARARIDEDDLICEHAVVIAADGSERASGAITVDLRSGAFASPPVSDPRSASEQEPAAGEGGHGGSRDGNDGEPPRGPEP
ncbi:MAG TPA: hypothetical protein VEL07_01505 [Planctomycetota bacterium]|nr:hypothetical protein [Planctomycetota bacterium]